MLSKELNIIDEKNYEDKWVQTEPCSVFSTGRKGSTSAEHSTYLDLKGDSWPKNPFRFQSPSFDDVGLRLPLSDENPLWLQNWGVESPFERKNAVTQIDSPRTRRNAITHVISPPSIEKAISESKRKGKEKSPLISPSLRKEIPIDRQLLQTPTPTKQYYDENVDYREKDEMKSQHISLLDDEGNPMKGVTTPIRASKKVPLKGRTQGGTPMPAPSSARLHRSVSRVKSYKEPSEKAKVRKGFQFFIYEDAAEES
jgi:hypothetical protein